MPTGCLIRGPHQLSRIGSFTRRRWLTRIHRMAVPQPLSSSTPQALPLSALRVLSVCGSPGMASRSSTLATLAGRRLAQQGASVTQLMLSTVDPVALVRADAQALAAPIAQVARADALIIATPIYKAAYSGLLKVFLDVLPQQALQGKRVLPLATGGSAHHMLAIDYALRPVLQSLGVRHVLSGVYATDAQWRDAHTPGDEVTLRLHEAVDALAQALAGGRTLVAVPEPERCRA